MLMMLRSLILLPFSVSARVGNLGRLESRAPRCPTLNPTPAMSKNKSCGMVRKMELMDVGRSEAPRAQKCHATVPVARLTADRPMKPTD
jgi:hypothetical protein